MENNRRQQLAIVLSNVSVYSVLTTELLQHHHGWNSPIDVEMRYFTPLHIKSISQASQKHGVLAIQNTQGYMHILSEDTRSPLVSSHSVTDVPIVVSENLTAASLHYAAVH